MGDTMVNIKLFKRNPPLQAVRLVNVFYFYTTYPREFYRPVVKDEAEIGEAVKRTEDKV